MPLLHPHQKCRYLRMTTGPVLFILFVLWILSLGYGASETALAQITTGPSTPSTPNQTQSILWPHDESDLTPDAALHFETLSNGLRVVLMENKEPKDRVSMHLVVQAGSLNEAEDQRGLAHFLEHMLFNGSTHFPPGELIKYFQMIGMTFGPDVNAHTGFDETVYDVLLPFGDAENIGKGLLVMKDYAQGAFLLSEEISRERGVILAEKRSRDSADYRTMEATLGFEFPDALLSKRLPIGDEDVIRAIDRPMMKTFYDTWYRPERMILVMVGDFQIQTAMALVREKMSDIQARRPPVPEPDFGFIDHDGLKAFYHYEPEAGTAAISIEMVRKVDRKKDSIDFRRKELYRRMAIQIVQNRLDKMLSDPKTPFTSANIHSGRFLERIFYSEISAESPSEKWEASLQQIEQTLRKALIHGFTSGELTRVKKDLLAALDNAVKQSATRKSSELASQIMWHLGNDRVMLSPQQEKRLLTPFIENATVTDIHGAFEKSWQADHRLVILTGNVMIPPKKNSSAESQLLSVFLESEKKPVQKQTETVLKTFPYLPPPDTEGGIASRREIHDLGIIQIEFENGVHLNLKKTDFEAGQVRASVVLGHGRSREPFDKPGLVPHSVAVMNESGVGALDKDELARALAGREARVWYGADEDKYTISGVAPSKEQTLMIQLLYAHIMDPALREDAHLLTLTRAEQQYQTLDREIDGALKLKGQRFLAGGDKRFGLPPLDDLKSLSLAEMTSWMTSILAHASIELSIVGDFEEKPLIEAVARYFGTLPKRTERENNGPQQPLPIFPGGKRTTVYVDTKIPKGLVVIAYPTDDFWNINRTRRLSVLANMFSERMREEIREELGASYSPFAFNRSSRAYPGYGLIQAFVYTAPEQVDAVTAAVEKIAMDMAQKGISQEELIRSLKPIVTRIKDYRRTNGYWLDSVLAGSSRYPQQLEWSRSFMSDYEAITLKEMCRLAEEYFVNKKVATVVILPETTK